MPEAAWGIAAGIIALAAFVPYVYTTLFGKTKPSRAAWSIWAVAGFMLAASYHSSVQDSTYWVAVSYFVGPLIVAILSIWYGEGGFDSWLDRACIVVAGVGALLWWIFGSPLVALWLNLGVDVFGVPPTIRKTYNEPESENLLTWLLFCIANTINLAIAESWHPSGPGIYPLAMFIGSMCMVTIIMWGRYYCRAVKR